MNKFEFATQLLLIIIYECITISRCYDDGQSKAKSAVAVEQTVCQGTTPQSSRANGRDTAAL